MQGFEDYPVTKYWKKLVSVWLEEDTTFVCQLSAQNVIMGLENVLGDNHFKSA